MQPVAEPHRGGAPKQGREEGQNCEGNQHAEADLIRHGLRCV
jgi:hypothetical protein